MVGRGAIITAFLLFNCTGRVLVSDVSGEGVSRSVGRDGSGGGGLGLGTEVRMF